MMPIESGYHVSKKSVILNAKQATAKISHMHTFLNSVWWTLWVKPCILTKDENFPWH